MGWISMKHGGSVGEGWTGSWFKVAEDSKKQTCESLFDHEHKVHSGHFDMKDQGTS